MGRRHKPSTTGRRFAAITAATAISTGAATALASAATAAEDPRQPDAIARCESGGNIRAQNPTSSASGKWQFITSTWLAYGGGQYAPTAAQATEAEQDRVAARLFAAEGTAPWNASRSCWAGKVGSAAPRAKAERAPERPRPVVKKQAPKAPAPKVVKQHRPAPAPVQVPAAARYTPGGDGEYVVKTGDTLSHLAVKHGTTVQRLMELNRGILEMPDWIFVGERIHLR